MHGSWMFQMWWFWVLVVAAVVIVLWLALRAGQVVEPRSGDAPGSKEQSPEEILKGRFARGEIGEEEYRRRRKALRDES